MSIINDKYRKEQDYQRVYSILIDAAESRCTIEYGEIAEILGRKLGGNFANWVGNVLGAINEDEHSYGRPLLGALAVNKNGGIPNKAFFTFAKDIGAYAGRTDDENKLFWIKEVDRVYKSWRK